MKYKLLSFGLLLSLFSCKSEDINCTMEFRAITVQVMDANNATAILDDYFVTIDIDTILNKDNEHGDWIDGSIIIFTDSQMDKTNTTGKTFRLTGYVNNALVVDEFYVIAHDKCHVELKSGKSVVIIP